MARKGNPISVRLDLNRSSDSSWFSEGDHARMRYILRKSWSTGVFYLYSSLFEVSQRDLLFKRFRRLPGVRLLPFPVQFLLCFFVLLVLSRGLGFLWMIDELLKAVQPYLPSLGGGMPMPGGGFPEPSPTPESELILIGGSGEQEGGTSHSQPFSEVSQDGIGAELQTEKEREDELKKLYSTGFQREGCPTSKELREKRGTIKLWARLDKLIHSELRKAGYSKESILQNRHILRRNLLFTDRREHRYRPQKNASIRTFLLNIKKKGFTGSFLDKQIKRLIKNDDMCFK